MSAESRTARIVVYFLGVIAVVSVIGAIKLVHDVIHHQNPTETAVAVLAIVGGLASSSIATLGALLVRLGSGADVQAVQVMNQPKDAVPVDPAGDAPAA